MVALGREDCDISQAGGSVDADMDKLPIHASSPAAFVPGDAGPQPGNLAQFFDSQVKHLARMRALATPAPEVPDS